MNPYGSELVDVAHTCIVQISNELSWRKTPAISPHNKDSSHNVCLVLAHHFGFRVVNQHAIATGQALQDQ